MTAILDFKAMFSRYMETNVKTWGHDRSKTVGASEAFNCLRKAWFSKRGPQFGFKPDPDFDQSWGATERGNIIENHFVVPALTLTVPEGAKLKFAGDKQKTFISGYNSATPDGLMVGLGRNALEHYGIADLESDCLVVEIKSVDPRVNLHEEKAVHHGQAQVQMGLIRENTVYKPMYAVVIYVDASFMDNIKVFVVRFNEEMWETAKKRASIVFSENDPSKIAPEGKFDNSCEYCPFERSCRRVTTGAMPTDEPDLAEDALGPYNEKMRPLVVEHTDIAKQSKVLDKRKKEVGQAIKDLLSAFRWKRQKADDFNVSWSSQKGRKGLDVEALQAEIERPHYDHDLVQTMLLNAGHDPKDFLAEPRSLQDFMRIGDPFDVLRVTLKGTDDASE